MQTVVHLSVAIAAILHTPLVIGWVMCSGCVMIWCFLCRLSQWKLVKSAEQYHAMICLGAQCDVELLQAVAHVS